MFTTTKEGRIIRVPDSTADQPDGTKLCPNCGSGQVFYSYLKFDESGSPIEPHPIPDWVTEGMTEEAKAKLLEKMMNRKEYHFEHMCQSCGLYGFGIEWPWAPEKLILGQQGYNALPSAISLHPVSE